MKRVCNQTAALTILFFAAMGVGCNRTVPPPTPLTLEELPGVVEKAFSTAKPPAKDLATQVVAAVRAQDSAKAFQTIQALGALPGLTKAQANVTARATLTITGLLQTAEAKGDVKAAQTMKRYMETK